MSNGSDSGQDDDIDFGPYLQQYLAGDEHALDALPPRERELALQLAPAFEFDPDGNSPNTIGSAAHAPPLEQDPIAIALGLVAGPHDVLSSKQLQRARKAAHIDLKEFVKRLQDRAWDVTVEEAFRWHSTDTNIAPALMKAIAETLNVSLRSLRGKRVGKDNTNLGAVLDDATIASYLAEWANETGEGPADVRDRVKRTLASASYRNRSDISREEVLTILRALRRIDPGGASS